MLCTREAAQGLTSLSRSYFSTHIVLQYNAIASLIASFQEFAAPKVISFVVCASGAVE
jgi:hypothetical protein